MINRDYGVDHFVLAVDGNYRIIIGIADFPDIVYRLLNIIILKLRQNDIQMMTHIMS